MTDTDTPTDASGPGGRVVRAAVWLPGLVVALGAAVATAHGLYEVAAAARVPAGIAWLYPLITDGLALVAYTGTARLAGSAARYAWAVVVLAAGLSGLAQAAYLASASPTLEAPAVLRFGVGAWPAIAAAIVAHLLYLLLDTTPSTEHTEQRSPGPVQAETFGRTTVHQLSALNTPPATTPSVQPPAAIETGEPGPPQPTHTAEQQSARPVESPARDRARTAAARHAARHGALPTVSELEALAAVSRGTAAAALKYLREHPTPLHLITTSTQNRGQDDDPTIEERSQP
ncbi:MAG: hypothetical protein J0I49_14955 [Pseudonocardia sp.]|jgi:hypothetical protein|uniref:hypothetical protein n=1 Tax=Pseudonocardia sp. TaxID=60912 RepID=UPI001ACF6327|nr:hypothetical protein [Pseudonocardia sp.]MBN9099393.1 hypothetical protein [Pseudonocardia sp.]